MLPFRLLGPIGQYRSIHVVPSKGKKRKKRKRKDVLPAEKTIDQDQSNNVEKMALDYPHLLQYITVGFNSTTRHLELLAQSSMPNILNDVLPHIESNDANIGSKRMEKVEQQLKPLVAVFVPREDQPSILHSHLPLLTTTASLASSPSLKARLVSLPKGAVEKLRAALGIPRVGLVGLMEDAPGSVPLVKFVREHVPLVEVPWLQEVGTGAYLPVEIKSIQTSAPVEAKLKPMGEHRGSTTRD